MDIIKSLDYEIKDLDEAKGIVQFYASSFDNIDSDRQIIRRGAYKKTLNERFKRIRHLLDHYLSIGVPLEGEETKLGLLMTSQLIMKKQAAFETFEEYKVYEKLGNTMEHSVRIRIIKSDNELDENKDTIEILKEVQLWDVSTITTWGANPNTPQVSLKNMKSIEDTVLYLEQMLKGRFSDNKLKTIENTLKQLKSLIDDEPHSTQRRNEPIDIVEFFNKRLKIVNYGN